MSSRIPILAIVGRPNVGKSTLFNRIAGARKAIVEDTPGVTRDRNYALVERFDLPFSIVDTGGLEAGGREELGELVREQALLAIEEADLILALFDGAVGLQPGDRDLVDLLRRESKPVLYVVNKCDGSEQLLRAAPFYELGVEALYDCSALHGRRVDPLVREALQQVPDYPELLRSAQETQQAQEMAEDVALASQLQDDEVDGPDEVEETGGGGADEPELTFAPVFLPDTGRLEDYEREHRLLPLDGSAAVMPEEQPAEVVDEAPPRVDVLRVAILGRPNVGKSTLLNTLLGEARAITSPHAGTTRDSLDAELKIDRDGPRLVLVDTAGIRRHARVSEKLERYAVLRSLSALRDADVAIVLLDALDGPTEQDVKIAGLAHDQGRGLILAVNKWDAAPKDHRTVHEYRQRIRHELKFAPYAPIHFISARTGKGCPQLLERVELVGRERMRRIPTHQLNQLLRRSLARVSAPSYRGQPVKLFFAAQVDVAPPRFTLFVDYPKGFHFSYLRHIKNAIRERYPFEGSEIKLVCRRRRDGCSER